MPNQDPLYQTLMDRMARLFRSTPKDIELPNESVRDPRLPPSSTWDKLMQIRAGKGVPK